MAYVVSDYTIRIMREIAQLVRELILKAGDVDLFDHARKIDYLIDELAQDCIHTGREGGRQDAIRICQKALRDASE